MYALLQRHLEDFLNIGRGKRCKSDQLALCAAGFLCHECEILIVNAEVAQTALKSECLKVEFLKSCDSCLSSVHIGKRSIYAEDIHTETLDLRCSFIAEDIGQPSRNDDSKSVTVGDVVESGKLMLDHVSDSVLRNTTEQEAVERPARCPHQI